MNARRIGLGLGVTLIVGLIIGCTAQQKSAVKRQPPTINQLQPASERTALDADRTLGTPKTFQNLTLIPVYVPGAKATNAFLTLDEGLKAKLVKVREIQGGGEVNKLTITNRSQKPLYIMAGEVVLGGQQDRCLADDTIIPPTGKEVPVTAFCVESGRWNGNAEFASLSKSVASAGVRASVQDGSFTLKNRSVDVDMAGTVARVQPARSARQTVLLSEATISNTQQKVWKDVAEKNAAFSVSNGTGSYRTLLESEAGEAKKTLDPYLKAYEQGLDSDPQLVGAMVAINGKVVAADIFGDPGLFRALWPKLLRSYAMDAAETASAPEAKKPIVVTAQMGKDFFTSARDKGTKAVNHSKVSSTLRLDSKEAMLYQFEASKAGLPAAAGSASAASSLHTNVLSK